MTILVTGGAGFIGSNFVLDWLACHDEPVVNVDKLTYAANATNLSSIVSDARYYFVKADVSNDYLSTLLSQHKIRAVVHFAAESHVDRSINEPDAFIQTNIVGTFRLLESTRIYWNQLAEDLKQSFRFIHISTDEIYGSLDENSPAFTEEHPCQPNSPYAASKAASNHLVRSYHHTYGLPVITTNCSNNYGPYQYPEKLIPLCIQKALTGEPLPLYGDGQHIRDWLYVSDHCAAIRAVLKYGVPGEVYNIGGRNEKKNLEVVHTICQLLDEMAPRQDRHSYTAQIAPVADRPGHDRRYAIDATKIARALDWRPFETFESGMRKTVEWYLTQHQENSHRAHFTLG